MIERDQGRIRSIFCLVLGALSLYIYLGWFYKGFVTFGRPLTFLDLLYVILGPFFMLTPFLIASIVLIYFGLVLSKRHKVGLIYACLIVAGVMLIVYGLEVNNKRAQIARLHPVMKYIYSEIEQLTPRTRQLASFDRFGVVKDNKIFYSYGANGNGCFVEGCRGFGVGLVDEGSEIRQLAVNFPKIGKNLYFIHEDWERFEGEAPFHKILEAVIEKARQKYDGVSVRSN